MDVKIAWLDNTPIKYLEKVLDVNGQLGSQRLKWFSPKNLGEALTNIPLIVKLIFSFGRWRDIKGNRKVRDANNQNTHSLKK